jgi:hypothetical protein
VRTYQPDQMARKGWEDNARIEKDLTRLPLPAMPNAPKPARPHPRDISPFPTSVASGLDGGGRRPLSVGQHGEIVWPAGRRSRSFHRGMRQQPSCRPRDQCLATNDETRAPVVRRGPAERLDSAPSQGHGRGIEGRWVERDGEEGGLARSRYHQREGGTLNSSWPLRAFPKIHLTSAAGGPAPGGGRASGGRRP